MVADEFSKHFEKIVNDRDLYKFPSCTMNNITYEIDYKISKFKFPPSIPNIQQNFT